MRCREATRWLGLWLACLCCACSLTHGRKHRNQAAAGSAADPGGTGGGGGGGDGAQAGMPAQPPAAGSFGGEGGTGGAFEPPPFEDDPFTPPVLGPLAPRVADRFKTLQEPDFAQPTDEVAAASCGSILRIEEYTHVDDPPLAEASAEVTRVFDAQGRLLVAEEHALVGGSTHLLLEGLTADDAATRLQLDYDAQGRIARVRQGALDELRNEHGTVIDFTYAADGSFQADVATTLVYSAEEDLLVLSERGFCERMEFDAQGRLTRTSWGCAQAEEARTFSYDAQGRLLEVTGRGALRSFGLIGSDPRFGESDEWSIRYHYDTADEVRIVWNELDLRDETPVEVEQRLVRRFDASGRLVATEFDYGNDGVVDERADYSYDDPASQTWTRQAYDFGLDGVIDVVEERTREGDTQLIERRHGAQWGDEDRFHYSVGHFYAMFRTGRHSSSPQSLSRWTLQLDAEDRVVSAELDMRLVPMPLDAEIGAQRFTSSLVQQYGAAGHVEHAAVESSGLAYVALGQLEMVVSKRETTCRAEPACAGGAIVLPDDPALTACQTDSGVSSRVLLPYMQPPYLPPPYDRIEAMRTRHAHAATFDPTPPTVRELVGY